MRGEKVQNRIRDLRTIFDLTQDELAEKLEVSRQTISSLEKGRYNPSIMLAYKIAKVFQCRIEDVFIFEGEEK
ncbi:helix-turn-helix transcriptional regulator [Ureibacillus manganicus]|uniref:helix-turn-helix transcriptional regulator n=1 Tax=Ureibacillus manganicus TaxID=1266064 RepID=UPI001F284E0B